jgi:hypothetical protein
MSPRSGALEIGGPADALIDEPLRLRARGAGTNAELRWRARLRDDDGRIWRSAGDRPEELALAWEPGKASTGPVAALRSLRPVVLEVRVDAADGRGASRTLRRRLLAEGVRRRRWPGAGGAVLHLPVGEPCATVIAEPDAASELAAPLLASRGVLCVLAADAVEARRLLEQVPGAGEPRVLAEGEMVLPPGIPARADAVGDPGARAAAWDALLDSLGARPRGEDRRAG